MYILVLSENILSSRYLSKGLKYENIYSKPMSLFDNWENKEHLYQFNAIVCRIPSKITLNEHIIKKFLSIPGNIPLFLITKNSGINPEFFKRDKNTHKYPLTVNLKILANKIKEIMIKKYVLQEQKHLKVADLKLDLSTREANRFNKKYFLRNKEFHLLEFLMANTNVILSRQKILENVWDINANLFTNTVDVHINSLRKKIDNNPEFQLIETIYCMGYMMHTTPYSKIRNQSML